MVIQMRPAGVDLKKQSLPEIKINIVEVTAGVTIDIGTIIGTVNFNLKSSSIMMPVDIQAQYLNLKIDIVAQTIGNIAINIAGQINDVTINLTAQSIAIKSQGEWSAQQSQQKVVQVGGYLTSGGTVSQGYTVTTGKTLYITDIGASLYACTLATDGDKNQIVRIQLFDSTVGQILFDSGGNGGLLGNLNSPFRVAAGHLIYIIIWNNSAHDANFTMYWKGYEI